MMIRAASRTLATRNLEVNNTEKVQHAPVKTLATSTVDLNQTIRSPKAIVSVSSPKASPDRIADLANIVKAGRAASHQPGISNPTMGQKGQKEQYGTNGYTLPNVDRPDRFGLGNDPVEQNPIDVINQRAGWGFNPQRDLRVPSSDAASRPLFRDERHSQGVGHKEPTPPSREVVFVEKEIEKAKAEGRKDDLEGWQRIRNMLKTPNPDAVDNSGGGPNDPLINNLGSNRRIRQPFVDPTREQQFGPSGVPKVRNQAVDPNPDADPNNGAAVKAIRSTSDAVTDPSPDVQLQKLNLMRLANLRG